MNKNPVRFFSLAAAALLALAAAAHADTLATWSLVNSLAGTSDANVLTAGDIVAGSGLKGLTNSANGYSAKGWPATSSPNDNAYFEFSVTASGDYFLNLSLLTMNLRSSPTGPQNVEVRWSADRTTWTTLFTSTHTADSKGHVYNVDASGLTVECSQTLYFRIYGYGGSSSSDGTFRLGNGSPMTLSGTAVGTKLPPTISFPSDAESVAVSNTLYVAIGVQPTGSGIASWSFAPDPAGTRSLPGSTFSFTPASADEGKTFTLSVTATNSYGTNTATLAVTVTEYVPEGAWMTGFETGANPAYPKATTNWFIDGRTWTILQLAFSGSTAQGDELPKVGARACVFGSDGNPASMTTTDKILDSTHGCGTVSFLYAEYPGESQPCQPLIVEIATDLALGDWMEVGRVNPVGVSELEEASFDVSSSAPVYLRLRTEYVDKSGRVCLDQLTVLPYAAPAWNDFEKYLLKYNVTPGDPGCASQNVWADGENDQSYLTDDFDEDGFSNWAEFQANPQTNPYDQNSHP